MKKLTVKSLCILIIAVMLLSGCGKTENSGNMPLEDKDENATGLEYGMSFYEPAVNMSFAVDGAPAMPEVESDFPEFNTEEYSYQKENSFISVLSNPFSTFAADVDTASYSNLRRQVLKNEYVDPDSVRVEELINYFRYSYPQPSADEPFGVYTEITACPWNEKTNLLRIGLQAKDLDRGAMPKSNLVFLIDVSGSMDFKNKLPLVQRSFMTLVENLDENDTVSIVTYSSGEKTILDGVKASEKQEIMAAIEGLYASGSTQGDKAIVMAYDLAKKHFIPGGNNRVIMATDGDFNVGITSEGELTRLIADRAKDGVFLSVLGYGMGNYKDSKLESLADNGNGNYAYIDSIDEARKVLVSEAGGTLFTVAKDVKIQVEFNPAMIKGYRLIGYENRVMAAEDFSDDTKDGGEIGAGHQVTALFEIVPAGSDFDLHEPDSKYSRNDTPSGEFDGEYCTVNIRYKEPQGDTSSLLSYTVDETSFKDTPTNDMKWAAGVAEVAMLIKDSAYKGTADFNEVKEYLKSVSDDDFRDEFVYLVSKLKNMNDN
jgi:Ca-activated chloride channel family protein